VELSFGAQVFSARMRLGLSQTQVAKLARVSQGYLSQIENERQGTSARGPSCARLIKTLHLDAPLAGQVQIPRGVSPRVAALARKLVASGSYLGEEDLLAMENHLERVIVECPS
jgi:transcriptional regulator with XRE-family HTH domain